MRHVPVASRKKMYRLFRDPVLLHSMPVDRLAFTQIALPQISTTHPVASRRALQGGDMVSEGAGQAEARLDSVPKSRGNEILHLL